MIKHSALFSLEVMAPKLVVMSLRHATSDSSTERESMQRFAENKAVKLSNRFSAFLFKLEIFTQRSVF